MTPEYHFAIAAAVVRILAGVVFFFQGYDKVFNVGMQELKITMRVSLSKPWIPSGFVTFIAYFTSYAELIGGFLLITGFFKFFAIYLLCADVLLVATGFSLAKPMWESNHILFRLILLIFMLITPPEWDIFSLDYLFHISRLTN